MPHVTNHNNLATAYPQLLKEWDYDKNDIEPNKVSPKSNKKVWWKCSICGRSWEARIDNRTRYISMGCPICLLKQARKQRILNGIKQGSSLAAKNPALASEWDYKKNGGLTPADVLANSREKVWWKCKDCGKSWKASIVSRNAGKGCKFCAPKKSAKTRILQKLQQGQSLADKKPTVAREWHPTKNGDLTPHDVTAGSRSKVWWLCPICKHEWEARVDQRNSGSSCRICKPLVSVLLFVILQPLVSENT